MGSIYSIQTGDKVSGTYCGTPYTGVVSAQRSHTMNHRIQMFSVALENPITVFGMERDGLLVTASDDHAALTQFLGHTLIDQTPIEARS